MGSIRHCCIGMRRHMCPKRTQPIQKMYQNTPPRTLFQWSLPHRRRSSNPHQRKPSVQTIFPHTRILWGSARL